MADVRGLTTVDPSGALSEPVKGAFVLLSIPPTRTNGPFWSLLIVNFPLTSVVLLSSPASHELLLFTSIHTVEPCKIPSIAVPEKDGVTMLGTGRF